MKIYNYDQVSGEFLGEEDADKNPLEDGEFLIPANATETAPPVTLSNQIAVYVNGVWTVENDYRGTEYFAQNGDNFIIDSIGAAVPPGHATTPPPSKSMVWDGDGWQFDIEALREQKLAELTEASKQALAPLVAGYSEEEQQSWRKQEDEAKAWIADNTAATPFLDLYLANTGLTKADAIAKILNKVTALEAASAPIIGWIVAKRAAIKDETATASEIHAIDLTITL
jgi:hypothetical protein